MNSLLLSCVLIFMLNKETNCLPKVPQHPKSESIFSLKNVNELVDFVSPLFTSGPKDVAGRAINTPIMKAINDLKETLTKAAKSDEGWTGFGKRTLSYILTGNKALQDGKSLDIQLAKKLYEKSPQFLKDSVKAQMDGSVLPVLEKKIEDIIQTIKKKKETAENEIALGPEGKQVTPFDPLVFGVNALINMFWFTSLNGYFLQNMGLENFFDPDYDYDYDALDKDKEEEGSEEAKGSEEGGDENAAGSAQHDTHENAIQPSSYSHYPGQRMVLPQHPVKHPSPHYNYFKLYQPSKKNKHG